jgi:hypothetical protein
LIGYHAVAEVGVRVFALVRLARDAIERHRCRNALLLLQLLLLLLHLLLLLLLLLLHLLLLLLLHLLLLHLLLLHLHLLLLHLLLLGLAWVLPVLLHHHSGRTCRLTHLLGRLTHTLGSADQLHELVLGRECARSTSTW